MPDDPVRIVEPGDRAAVLVCFDTTAGLAFTVLSRLTAGDAAGALDLLVDTYAYLGRTARRSGWNDVDAQWVVDAAHSVYAAMSATSGPDGFGPVTALTPSERVALSLHLVERRTLDEVAAVLDVCPDDIAAALRTGAERLAAVEVDDTAMAVDVIRRGEVWFDDSMRSHARLSVANGWSSADAPAAKNPSMLATSAPIVGAMRMPITPFATREPEHFAEAAEFMRTRRSRWTVVGAGLGIAAVLVALAVWVMPSNDGGTDEAASLTSATSTSTPASEPIATTDDTIVVDPTTGATTGEPTGGVTTDDPTATSDPAAVAGFVLDPLPDGYVRDSAGSLVSDAAAVNWFELWATPDAKRASGRWFAVLAIDANSSSAGVETLSTTARRVDVAGSDGVIDTAADRVTDLTVEYPGRQEVHFESFGLAEDQLVTLAAATTFGNSNQPVYGAAAHDVVDGLDLVTSRATTQTVLAFQIITGGGTGSRVQYQTTDGTRFLSVITAPQSDNDLRISGLLSTDFHDPAAVLATDRIVDIGGRAAHIGAVPSPFKSAGLDPELPFVQWHTGASTVTIVGITDLQTLLAATANARLATNDEWHQAVVAPRLTYDTPADPAESTDDTTVPVEHEGTIGGGTTANGVTFAFGLSDGQTVQLIVDTQRSLDPSSTSSAPFSQSKSALEIHPDPEHPLLSIDTLAATIVVVAFEGPPPAAAMRVTLDGQSPVIVPIAQVAATPLYGSAFAFSEHVAYSVDLLDGAGDVISSLHP